MTARKINNAPPGVFEGNNFMTPTVESYYKTTYQGEPVYVELSIGRGMSNEPIFGVTVRMPDGSEPWSVADSPSKCVFSRAEALEYIDELETYEENDDDYGRHDK